MRSPLIVLLLISISLLAAFTFIGFNPDHAVSSTINFNINHNDLIQTGTYVEESFASPAFKIKAFEGKIETAETSFFDTSYSVFTVKDEFVRVDELNDDKELIYSYIFNLEKHEIIALHHTKKLYFKVPVRPYTSVPVNGFQIIKTNNSKMIQGLKCYQWRVRNRSEKTEITYWVARNQFVFFEKMLRIWNLSDKRSLYFLTIPDVSGVFPLEQVERTLLRDIKSVVKVTRISEGDINNKVFEIPEDYAQFTN